MEDIEQQHQLQQFGRIMTVATVAIFGLLLPLAFHTPHSRIPWCIALIFISATYLSPRRLGWFYHIWMSLGHVLNVVNTHIILSVLFYGLFVPIGILRRLVHDPLALKWQKQASSYRVIPAHRDITHMEHPY